MKQIKIRPDANQVKKIKQFMKETDEATASKALLNAIPECLRLRKNLDSLSKVSESRYELLNQLAGILYRHNLAKMEYESEQERLQSLLDRIYDEYAG